MNDKPIIRHCRNCKWADSSYGTIYCDVIYDVILCERIKALFCWYFKKKEQTDEN